MRRSRQRENSSSVQPEKTAPPDAGCNSRVYCRRRYREPSFAAAEVSPCGQGKKVGLVSYYTTLTPPLGLTLPGPQLHAEARLTCQPRRAKHPTFALETRARWNSPAPKASGWPNEVSPQCRKSPSGHHRLLVPGRRFAQAEHRHGHPDRLRPWPFTAFRP